MSTVTLVTPERLSEINLLAFMCTDAVWLWQNAAFHAHRVIFYSPDTHVKIYNAIMWTVCVPSLIGAFFAYRRHGWSILQLVYVGKNIIMIGICLLRMLDHIGDYGVQRHVGIPDLLEWLTSIPFFGMGIYLTMRVVQRDSMQSIVGTMQTAIAEINGQVSSSAPLDNTPAQQWSKTDEQNLV